MELKKNKKGKDEKIDSLLKSIINACEMVNNRALNAHGLAEIILEQDKYIEEIKHTLVEWAEDGITTDELFSKIMESL